MNASAVLNDQDWLDIIFTGVGGPKTVDMIVAHSSVRDIHYAVRGGFHPAPDLAMSTSFLKIDNNAVMVTLTVANIGDVTKVVDFGGMFEVVFDII